VSIVQIKIKKVTKMNPVEIVITSIDKYLTDKIKQPNRRGPNGYELVLKLRLLVYGVLKGLHYTRELERHLKKNPDISKELGFAAVPHRTTIDRWKKIVRQRIKGTNFLIG